MPKQNPIIWKEKVSVESPDAFWEIVHDSKAKTVKLIFVPDEESALPITNISMNYEHFTSLIKFINRFT